MRITDHIDLFYPNAQARERAAARRKETADSGSRFIDDIGLEGIKRLITLSGADRIISLSRELCMDIPTIEYRLDCLEDHLNNPELSDSFRALITELSLARSGLCDNDDSVNAFYDIKEKMDGLSSFLGTVGRINKLYERIGRGIKSEAMRGLFEFFASLPESDELKGIAADLDEMREALSKTIRSVKVGINFDSNMVPDSAGILEVSYDKIYPKGNVLEKLVYGSLQGKEKFAYEEHFNSLNRHTPVDIDTALFRELSEYTKDYAKRIASALKSYRSSIFEDINELEHQLDYYEGAAAFIKSVRSHGMKMCRPKLLPKEQRKTVLRGAYDLGFYKQLLSQDRGGLLDEKIVTNDLTLDEHSRFFMVTGANNGGKTTFARALGLCQAMAQAGLYVPAEYAEISIADNIFTHFPRDEEVGIDTSRFTNEIKDLKAIARQMTPYSLVILNESLQSTTPEECLKIAEIHLELIAAAGVRGLYVTHLTELYKSVCRLNDMGCPTKLGSLVSLAGEGDKRLYRFVCRPPSGESLAMSIYRQFGATLEDIKARGGSDE